MHLVLRGELRVVKIALVCSRSIALVRMEWADQPGNSTTLNGKLTLATASSGITATLLKSGTTAHSAFKLPIPANGISMCGFKRIDAAGRRIREASILVWD